MKHWNRARNVVLPNGDLHCSGWAQFFSPCTQKYSGFCWFALPEQNLAMELPSETPIGMRKQNGPTVYEDNWPTGAPELVHQSKHFFVTASREHSRLLNALPWLACLLSDSAPSGNSFLWSFDLLWPWPSPFGPWLSTWGWLYYRGSTYNIYFGLRNSY